MADAHQYFSIFVTSSVVCLFCFIAAFFNFILSEYLRDGTTKSSYKDFLKNFVNLKPVKTNEDILRQLYSQGLRSSLHYNSFIDRTEYNLETTL